jgi:DNA invertase Pin-like site-specific DNA recombinase
MKRVVLYVRVSTQQQRGGVGMQIDELTEWAERRGFAEIGPSSGYAKAKNTAWPIPSLIIEKASAWTTAPHNRPGWSSCLELAANGDIDAVCVWALDRVCRSGIADMLDAFSSLERRGVELLSLNEPWLEELDASTRPLILSVLGWVSERESARRSVRVKAGMDRARRNGLEIGRPSALVDECELARLASEGHSQRVIAERMGITRGMVRRRIKVLKSRGVFS